MHAKLKVIYWKACLYIVQESQREFADDDLADVEIVYTPEILEIEDIKKQNGFENLDEETLNQFSSVFKHFQIGNNANEVTFLVTLTLHPRSHCSNYSIQWKAEDQADAMEASEEADLKKKEVNGDDSDADENEEGGPLSKKKLKKVSRLSVAELKQLVDKPDVVEVRRYVSSTPVPHLFDL